MPSIIVGAGLDPSPSLVRVMDEQSRAAAAQRRPRPKRTTYLLDNGRGEGLTHGSRSVAAVLATVGKIVRERLCGEPEGRTAGEVVGYARGKYKKWRGRVGQ
jgi:hypothetical protein